MLTLALDTSGDSLSVSILEQEKIISKIYINNNNFHSEKILTCTQKAIQEISINIENIDLFAVCNGPGSFTGIRIGMSFIKGMAFMLEKPCIGISSLFALAYPFRCLKKDEIIYSCLYANKDEIYFNSYIYDKISKEICANNSDSFMKIDEIIKNAKNEKKRIIFVGNMAEVCYNKTMAVFPDALHKFYNKNIDSDYIGQAAYYKYLKKYLNLKNRDPIEIETEVKANYIKGSRAEKI